MQLKSLFYSLCAAALLGLVSCHSSEQAGVSVNPASPATPAVKTTPAQTTTKPNADKPAAAVSAASAEATRAMAARITPAVPGVRVSRVQVPGMYVALTFDDGPHGTLTPKALDILARHNAHGTFFVQGQNAAAHRSILARAAAEGNEIGVHTWSHIKMTSAGTAKIDSEISRTVAVIQSATGKAPRVMRPPYGATNKNIIAHMYNDYGMYSILWDVDTLDWKHHNPQKVISTAVSQAKPGSIILVHDIHASTLAALEGVVTGLQARGFKLVTVSQLMALARQAAGAPNAAPQVPVVTPAPAPAAPSAPVTPVEEPASAAETPAAPVVTVNDTTPAPVAAPAPVAEEPTPAATPVEEPAAQEEPAEVPVTAPAEAAPSLTDEESQTF